MVVIVGEKLSEISDKIFKLTDKVTRYYVDNAEYRGKYSSKSTIIGNNTTSNDTSTNGMEDSTARLDLLLNDYIKTEIEKLELELGQLVKVTSQKKKKKHAHDEDTASAKPSDSLVQPTASASCTKPTSTSNSALPTPPPSWTLSEKATFKCLLGQMYNIYSNPCRESYESFGSALKLDPQNSIAWNGLGEFYWKTGDFEMAKTCFESGLEWSVNACAYWKLAMVYRQLGKTTVERQHNVEKSIALCKKAILIEPNDPHAWLALGNGYLKLFFNYTHQKSDIQKALSAYTRAESCKPNFDIYHSLGVVNDFLENFDEALKYYRKAREFDPRVSNVHTSIAAIETHLSRFAEVLEKKCFLKNKKFSLELDALKSELNKDDISDISCLDSCKAFKCRIIYNTSVDDATRRSFVAIDALGNLFGLTVYNLASSASSIRESVNLTILQPELKTVSANLSHAKSIRIVNPKNILVRGLPVPSKEISLTWINVASQ